MWRTTNHSFFFFEFARKGSAVFFPRKGQPGPGDLHLIIQKKIRHCLFQRAMLANTSFSASCAIFMGEIAGVVA